MTKFTKSLLFSSALLSTSAYAGEPEVGTTSTPEVTPVTETKYVDFSVNARLRVESREAGSADQSTAGTFRIRPGITLLPDSPISLFAESEHTYAFIDDYASGPGAISPNVANNTQILDPETNELNQLYLTYKAEGFSAKVGRQRIVLDNAAFIGNVGWRQNEQTYDAATLGYKFKGFSLSYSYANQANRIFGSDATGVAKELEGDMHFINVSKAIGDVTLGAYGYLLDFDEAGANAFANRASGNTYGAYAKYKGLHLEYAEQRDASGSDLDRESNYAHVYYGTKIDTVSVKVGAEYLDQQFYTPLATVHAFNGFADAFIGQRLGLADGTGITEFYGSVGTKVGKVAVTGFAHYYFDDSMSQDFGWELDLVAATPLTDYAKLVTKVAYYDGGFAADDDITQLSAQVDFNF
ncbi:alginate export family protein [Akkermansiaceae bacterium]|nr:alginate export family protein [Akkermansiaceae bacterium]